MYLKLGRLTFGISNVLWQLLGVVSHGILPGSCCSQGLISLHWEACHKLPFAMLRKHIVKQGFLKQDACPQACTCCGITNL